MNQRVNINYSIDMEELDGELKRLLDRSSGCLSGGYKELRDLVANINADELLTTVTVERISDIRENLAKVDFILSDVNRIIGAYISYQLGQEEVTQAPGAPAEASAHQPQTLMPEIYPSNFQGATPEQIEKSANDLQKSIQNGEMPPELDPELLKQKLEEFKKLMKNT